MASAQVVAAAILSFLSLLFACVMLAGSSDNCDVVKDAAWGHSKTCPFGGCVSENYFGTTKVCKEWFKGFEGLDRLEDLDDLGKSQWWVSLKDNFDNAGDKLQVAWTNIKGGVDSGKYTGDCKDAGEVANGFTGAVFILTFIVFVASLMRRRTPGASSFLKGTAVLLSILAVLCVIIAIGHFDDVCLSDNDVDPSVSIILGAVMVFLLTITAVLHAVA